MPSQARTMIFPRWEDMHALFDGTPRLYQHSSQRFLVGAWLLTVLVLANSFASLLKSYQAFDNFFPAVDSIRDLAERPQLRPVLPKETTYEQYGKTSSSAEVRKVWAAAGKKGFVAAPDIFTSAGLREVSQRRAVIMVDKNSILFNIARFCERENVRNFHLAKEPILRSPMAYGFSKS